MSHCLPWPKGGEGTLSKHDYHNETAVPPCFWIPSLHFPSLHWSQVHSRNWGVRWAGLVPLLGLVSAILENWCMSVCEISRPHAWAGAKGDRHARIGIIINSFDSPSWFVWGAGIECHVNFRDLEDKRTAGAFGVRLSRCDITLACQPSNKQNAAQRADNLLWVSFKKTRQRREKGTADKPN